MRALVIVSCLALTVNGKPHVQNKARDSVGKILLALNQPAAAAPSRVSEASMMAARRKPVAKKTAKNVEFGDPGFDPFSPAFADIGVTKPLGYYDPLKIRTESPERYRRFVEMEIKHGRLAMAATVGVLVTSLGFRFPGYLSTFANGGDGIKFADVPGGAISSWAAVPELGWLQIVALISVLDVIIFKQDPDREPGDTVPDYISWKRYPDGPERDAKLNAERNNGRLAMMGIFGMLANEALTGNPIYPFNQ